MSKLCPLTNEYVIYQVCQECPDRMSCSSLYDDLFALLIAGTRTYDNYDEFSSVTDMLLKNHQDKNVIIVSGGATGADALARKYAQERGLRYLEFPADWAKGKSAGYERNRKMHEYVHRFRERGVVCFWDGASRGTAHSFELSREFENPIRVYCYTKKIFYDLDLTATT